MSEFTIHRISPELLPKFTQLYNLVFKANFTMDFFIKKFDTQWTGLSYIGFMALDKENEPAGYYGVYPCQFNHNNSIVLGAQSADTMTHPNHQKKGLFKTLLEKTCQLCEESGIKYLYGFPNHNSFPQFKKLNWTCEGYLLNHKINVSPRLVAKILRRFTPAYYSKYVKNVISNKNGSTIASSFMNTRLPGFSILRDSNYLTYKAKENIYYFKNDSGEYLFKVYPFHILIGDFKLNQGFSISNPALIDLANKIGVDEIIFDITSDLISTYPALKNIQSGQGLPIISKSFSNFEHGSVTLTSLDFDTY